MTVRVESEEMQKIKIMLIEKEMSFQEYVIKLIREDVKKGE
jgi:predicted DNA binding CopG/RHH family protein